MHQVRAAHHNGKTVAAKLRAYFNGSQLMSEIHKVNQYFSENGLVDAEQYAQMYRNSIEDSEGFWAEQGKIVDWIKPFTKVKDVSFARDDLHIRWYEDGVLNACYNCVDRHLSDKRDQTAIIWEGDDPRHRPDPDLW